LNFEPEKNLFLKYLTSVNKYDTIKKREQGKDIILTLKKSGK